MVLKLVCDYKMDMLRALTIYRFLDDGIVMSYNCQIFF